MRPLSTISLILNNKVPTKGFMAVLFDWVSKEEVKTSYSFFFYILFNRILTFLFLLILYWAYTDSYFVKSRSVQFPALMYWARAPVHYILLLGWRDGWTK